MIRLQDISSSLAYCNTCMILMPLSDSIQPESCNKHSKITVDYGTEVLFQKTPV